MLYPLAKKFTIHSHIAGFTVYVLRLALVAWSEPSTHDDPRTQAPLMRTATVVSAMDRSHTFTGVVVARIQSDLSFRVQGKILERLVDTGQTVKRGQPLMRLDPIDLTLQSQAQQQVVEATRARAKQATQDETHHRSRRWGSATGQSADENS